MVGRQFLFSFLLLFTWRPFDPSSSHFFLVWFVFVLHTLLSICTNTYERMRWKIRALDLWGTRTLSVIVAKTLIWHQIWRRKTSLPFLLFIKTIIIIIIACSSPFLNVFASFHHHTQLGHSYKPSILPSPISTPYSLPSWDSCLVLGCIWDCQVWDSPIKEGHGGSMWPKLTIGDWADHLSIGCNNSRN